MTDLYLHGLAIGFAFGTLLGATILGIYVLWLLERKGGE